MLCLELHPPRVNFIIVRALFEGGLILLSSARARSAASIRGWEEIEEIRYIILQGVLPIRAVSDMDEQHASVDKLVKVCCGIVNLCPSVVPQD